MPPVATVALGPLFHRRRAVIDTVCVAVVATLLAWPSFSRPLTSVDESILLVYGEQVKSGLVPHRDFFTVYGPAPFYILAGLFSSLGGSLEVERALGLALHIAVALGCYLVGRSRDRLTALLAASLSLTILFPLGTVAYAWLGAIACLVGAVGLAQLGRRRADFGAGLLTGLSATFRPEMLVMVLPVLAPHMWRTGRWRWAASGFLVGVSPLVMVSATAGERMWQNIVLGRVGVNGALRLADDPVRSIVVLAPVAAVTCILVWFAWSRRSRVAISHGLLAVGVLPQALQRVDPEHAMYTLCVTAPLVVIGAAGSRPTAASIRRRRMLVAALSVALVGGMGATLLRASPDAVRVRVQDRSALIAAHDAAAVSQTRSQLLRHAPPGGGLFVGSTDMSRTSLSRIELYYLMPELRPRAYFLELAVGVSEQADSGLVDDIRAADVLLLTAMPDELREHLFPYLTKGSDEANDVVRREFCLAAETGWGMVYERGPCTDARP